MNFQIRNIALALSAAIFSACVAVPVQTSWAQTSETAPAQDISKVKSSAKPSRKTQKKHPGAAQKVVKNADHFMALVRKILETEKSEQYGSALAYCQEALADIPPNMPQDVVFSTQLACVYLYGRNKKYAEELELIQKIAPNAPNETMAQAICLQESTALTQLERFEDARKKLESCPTTGDAAGAIAGNLAELYMTQGDLQNAISAYKKAIAIDPKNQHALYGMAPALARAGLWQDALIQFTMGIRRDPGFQFLKDAFFVPEAERDFQLAFMNIALHRYREAVFYLKRYVGREQRAAYKEQGRSIVSQLSDALASDPALTPQSYPVLAENVRAFAIDASGKYAIFANATRPSAEKLIADIYRLELETDKVARIAQIENVPIADMAFVADTTLVRILGTQARFEIDAAAPQNGVYRYDNDAQALPLAFMPNSRDILTLTLSGFLAIAPWDNFTMQTPILQMPDDARRAAISPDHAFAVVSRAQNTEFVSLLEQKISASLPLQFDINQIAIHPQKKLFAIAIQSGTLIMSADGVILTMVASLGRLPAEKVSFDPSGKNIAILSGQTMEIYDLDSLLHPWTPVTPSAERPAQM